MVWDKNRPYGSDLISQGDDYIRELKSDLENAFKTEFGSNWNGSPELSVHNLLGIPELNLQGQIKLRHFTGDYYSLDIYTNNNWIRGTQIVDFAIDTILVSYSTQSFFGWETVALQHEYFLAVGANVVFNTGYSPADNIIHTHSVQNSIHSIHGHVLSASMRHTNDKEDTWRIWQSGDVWKRQHTHHINLESWLTQLPHTHTMAEENVGNFHTCFCKLIKRIL